MTTDDWLDIGSDMDIDSEMELHNDMEKDDVMVYIDLDIEIEEEINNGNFEEISVSEILKKRSLSLEAAPFDFDGCAKLCEDVPCCSHSLDLVATVDFKKVLSSIRPLSLKVNHDEAFGKLQKLWNLSNRSILASEIIYAELGIFKFNIRPTYCLILMVKKHFLSHFFQGAS